MTPYRLAEHHVNLLRGTAPASFFDLRQCREPVDALLFRTRTPFRPQVALREVPFTTKILPFYLTSIMCGPAQVGVVIYHPSDMQVELLRNSATIATDKVRAGNNLGKGRLIMKLNDLLLFDFDTRNAIVAVRTNKGKG